MIAWLAGRVASAGADAAVIDVGGVGYLVQASGRTLSGLAVGEAAQLHVETQVREDAITLFGFAGEAERDWFRLLTALQGVGGRVALNVLSVLPPADLARAVAAGDRASVGRASGVGPKLATRIVTELKDKAGAVAAMTDSLSPGQPLRGPRADAVSALENLGFKPAEAARAVAEAAGAVGEEADEGALIAAALKRAAR